MYERRMLRLLPLLCCHSVTSFFSRAIFLFLFLSLLFFRQSVFFLNFWAKKPPRKPRQENKHKTEAAKETLKGCDFWSLLKLSFPSRSDECASLSRCSLVVKVFFFVGSFLSRSSYFCSSLVENERTNERMNDFKASRVISSSLIRCVRLKRLSVFCSKDDDDTNESLSLSLSLSPSQKVFLKTRDDDRKKELSKLSVTLSLSLLCAFVVVVLLETRACVFYAREFSRARFNEWFEDFLFLVQKTAGGGVFFQRKKQAKKKDVWSLSLSLRRKSSREKEEEHALQILTKRALVEQTSRVKSPAR